MTFETQSPLYQQPAQVTPAAIKNRLVADAQVIGDLDLDIGSWEDDVISVVANELAQAAWLPQRLYQRVFVDTATGSDLDALADETGIAPRLGAVPAQGTVQFNGPSGTVIPAGTRVGTATGITYATTTAITIPNGVTSYTTTASAVVPGVSGNQPIGAVVRMVDQINGITAITNTTPMAGGADVETDEELRARIKLARSEKSVSGNRAEIRNEAMTVNGVGGVEIMYANQGNIPDPVHPGDVRVTLIGTDHLPASSVTVEAVRDDLSQPWRIPNQASTQTLSAGAVTNNAQADSAYGVCVYFPTRSVAQLVVPTIQAWLPQASIWEMRPVLKKTEAGGNLPLFTIGVWDFSINGWAPTTPGGSTSAQVTVLSGALPGTFGEVAVGDVWLDMTHQMELRITRLNTAGTTDRDVDWYMDAMHWRSATQREDIDNFLPGYVRLRVQPAQQVNIDFVVNVTYFPGYTVANVNQSIKANLVAYLASIPFGEGVSQLVQVGAMGDAVFQTPGVASYDYSSLTINGAQANVSILAEQVAVLRNCAISGVPV